MRESINDKVAPEQAAIVLSAPDGENPVVAGASTASAAREPDAALALCAGDVDDEQPFAL
jgi:hypothetical protein